MRIHFLVVRLTIVVAIVISGGPPASRIRAQDDARWEYSPDALQPCWATEVVHDEPVLFIRDPETGESSGALLFPIKKIISARNAAGDMHYSSGSDYACEPGTRHISAPADSRVISKSLEELRRPANSQRYRLTHRDGNGEILFGEKAEYHVMQTWVTYTKANGDWPVSIPAFDAQALPRTIARLKQGKETTIVLLGDSISTGCNASGWAETAPYQPAYPELVQRHLAAHYESPVNLVNLSVGGQATPWGLSMMEDVIAHKPDLVILAFGMNDAARLSAEEYGDNTRQMVTQLQAQLPAAEIILVASMLGNRDWTLLNHAAFPAFREQLKQLCRPGVALADLTSIWEEFLKRKRDSDLTGNGVNHPNDFGHRVYAQVISGLLVPAGQR